MFKQKNKSSMPGILVLLFSLSFLVLSCSHQQHFLNDPAYRKLVHQQYLKRMELARGRSQELFSIMKQPLRQEEKEALEFLYAFMPLSDLANLDGQYFLDQVRTAFEARRFFSWGKNIPEDIFRHFVLPYRVNNENPDNARRVFFEELKERIKNLNMYQAALEVNHWCHEKVTYRATDERTSAPLATVKTAFGRCGEESVFTVAALRAVSIPARQVYTPRWAHTDDNHAWVEVWVDGQWYYLGACEPEPELNMAWFTGPAKRAMMVHTTVFGQYRGPEEVLLQTDLYTKINQLPVYAPTTRLTVVVRDEGEKPVAGAQVDFCLYNYAEFYPIATKITDENGQASLITGLGDLLVWASKEGRYAFAKVSVGTDEQTTLYLQEPDFAEKEIDLDIVPPVARKVEPADPAKVKENNRRLKEEDAIREAYVATFITREKAEALAREKGLPPELTWKFLQTSRGNWQEIVNFLSALKPEEIKYGLGLLAAITEKDLRDTPAEILLHHLRQSPPKPAEVDDDTYIRFILSPRIGRELLTAWRDFIQKKFSEKEKEQFRQNPQKIADWIMANIKLDNSNYYNVPLFPQGTLQLGVGDAYSRKILFVAIARTLGIPAKINQANGRPAYWENGQWREISLEKEEDLTSPAQKATLRLIYEPAAGIDRPGYYTHFTLARLENGRFKTLDYENDPALASFPCELQVDPGYYLLVTGNRQTDGSVLCRLKFFMVPPEGKKEIHFTLRKQLSEPKALGQLSPEAIVTDFGTRTSFNLSNLVKNKSSILLLIEPDKEPTKHLMEEIQALQDQFSSWSGIMVIAVAQDKAPAGFSPDLYKHLPANAMVVYDSHSELSRAISQALKNPPLSFPVVVACRHNGEIIFYSEGYRIGTGEQLIKNLPFLK